MKTTAKRAGHTCLIQPKTENIEASRMRELRRVNCHDRGWRSESIYIVSEHKPEFGRAEVVITELTPVSENHFLIDQLDFAKTFVPLAMAADDAALWDICRALCGTYSEAAKHARSETKQEFAEGRLKLSKVRGRDQYRVVAA